MISMIPIMTVLVEPMHFVLDGLAVLTLTSALALVVGEGVPAMRERARQWAGERRLRRRKSGATANGSDPVSSAHAA